MTDPFNLCPFTRTPTDTSWRSLPPELHAVIRSADEPKPGQGWYNADRRFHSRHFFVGANKYSVLRLLAEWRYGRTALKLKPVAYWSDGDPTNETPDNVSITERGLTATSQQKKATGRPKTLPIDAIAGTPEYQKQYARIRRARLVAAGIIPARTETAANLLAELVKATPEQLHAAVAAIKGAPALPLAAEEPEPAPEPVAEESILDILGLQSED